MHIVEIIIVAVLMFFLIFQFSNIPRAYADWSRAKLTLQAYDVLFSLEGSGLNWSNPTEVGIEMDGIFGDTSIIYRVETEDSSGVRSNIVGRSVGKEPVTAYLFRVLDTGEGTSVDFQKVILSLGYLY